MRADLLNRIERVKAVLGRRQSMGVTLVYADGSTRSMGTLEAVEAISNTPGIVEAEAADPTAQSLLNAMLPSGQDFTGLVENE